MDVTDDRPVFPVLSAFLSSLVFLDLLPTLDCQGALCLTWQCPNLTECYY